MQRTFFHLPSEQIVKATVDKEYSASELSIVRIKTVTCDGGDESIKPAIQGPSTGV